VGIGLGNMIIFLRCTTSGAADNCLGTDIKYLLGATGIGLGTTMKYLRRTTSVAAGNGLGNTINYLRRTTRGAAGSGRALPGAMIKFLRGATGVGLSTTTKYLRRLTSGAAVNRPVQNGQVPARRRGHRPWHHDQVPAMHDELFHGHGLGTTAKYLVNQNEGASNN
jgi:hypothetical protein